MRFYFFCSAVFDLIREGAKMQCEEQKQHKKKRCVDCNCTVFQNMFV